MSDFVWDATKAQSNLKKHGVTFEQACEAFYDPFALEFEDDRFQYVETRWILIGMTSNNLLVVVHSEADERTRIISARPAKPNEKRAYFGNRD